MSESPIQELLPLVETPSRYIGSEVNTIRKDPASVDFRVVLAFPDLYEIGTSHFGMQILYNVLNGHPRIAAERVFSPATDMAGYLKERDIPLTSLESAVPLKNFDMVGVSLLYELNYTNVLNLLDLARIPLLSRDRAETDPVVVGGGPCTCNPEPVADFFDALVFGDGESVVLEMAEAWMAWSRQGGTREELLRLWSAIPGIYIPSFFTPRYDDNGFQHLEPRCDGYVSVDRAIVGDLDMAPFPQKPLLPFGRPVHDRLRIELSRGCTRGCRFCQAGMIYRPVRERSPDRVMALCDAALTATGYEDISLLSLSTGDYTCLAELLKEMMTRYACDHVAVSLPSVRADVLTPDLMELIRKVRKTGFTIAPEAGSQRLRDVINKNISEEQIRDAVRDAFAMGWQIIKLYFMVGLPTETISDLEEMVALVNGLRKIRTPGGRYGKINVSVATFIPKPHTPFQWSKQAGLSESRETIDWLKRRMKLPGVQFKWQNPEMSFLEGLMARGDRRMALAIESAFKKGCRFDGWSDHFRFDLWMEAIEESGIDPAFFLTRTRGPGDPLPWGHMKSGVTDAYLEEEWLAAETLKPTGDCRDGGCNQCGVCDFDTLKPRTFDRFDKETHPPPDPSLPRGFRKLDIYFSKIGPARLFGHLEMVNIITRAMKRAGVPIKYTEGFHPKPKIAFLDALPIGMESLHEVMVAVVGKHFGCQSLVRRLNRELPEGLRIIGCTNAAPRKKGADGESESTYRVRLYQGEFDAHRVRTFLESNQYIIERRSKKGRLKKIDLRAMVQKLTLQDTQSLTITLRHREGVVIRPAEFLESAMGMEPTAIREARMVRLGSESIPTSSKV